MIISIKAERVLAKELRPGDLFSFTGSGYWNRFPELSSVAVRVHIRTHAPCSVDQGDESIYRLTIVRDEQEGEHP